MLDGSTQLVQDADNAKKHVIPAKAGIQSFEKISIPMETITMTGKYTALGEYLRSQPNTKEEINLNFKEVEKIIGSPLPKSAHQYQAFWANQLDTSNRPQARAWIDAGFIVDSVKKDDKNGWIKFRREKLLTIGKQFSSKENHPKNVSGTDSALFETVARDAMSRKFHTNLKQRSVDGVRKKFDLVSDDGTIIGDAKFYSAVNGNGLPPAKFATIAEYVWLLEKTNAKHKFLVFGNDRRVPMWWLERYESLLNGVDFYFLDKSLNLQLLSEKLKGKC